jgi:hypothetical protein
MIARGELGNDTAVRCVHGDLAVHDVGENAAFAVHDRGRRFVAGRLQAEDEH